VIQPLDELVLERTPIGDVLPGEHEGEVNVMSDRMVVRLSR